MPYIIGSWNYFGNEASDKEKLWWPERESTRFKRMLAEDELDMATVKGITKWIGDLIAEDVFESPKYTCLVYR